MRRDDVYGAPSAPSSPLPATPSYETPSDAPYVTPSAGATTPGLGEGEREQPAGTMGSTGSDAMGTGAPSVPSAPAGTSTGTGSLDSGATNATGQTPPSSAGTGAAPLPSSDASSGTYFGQPMSSGDLSGSAPTGTQNGTGMTDDAADEDLNDNGIDDDEENERDDATP